MDAAPRGSVARGTRNSTVRERNRSVKQPALTKSHPVKLSGQVELPTLASDMGA